MGINQIFCKLFSSTGGIGMYLHPQESLCHFNYSFYQTSYLLYIVFDYPAKHTIYCSMVAAENA